MNACIQEGLSFFYGYTAPTATVLGAERQEQSMAFLKNPSNHICIYYHILVKGRKAPLFERDDNLMTKEKLEEIIESYGKDIYSFCLKLAGGSDPADDLYQDTWLYAVKTMENLDEGKNVRSYLISVAIHLWKNKKRKYAWRKRIAPEEEIVEEKDEDCEKFGEDNLSICINNEQRTYVNKAVSSLKDKYRIPILLFYKEEMSVGEISEVMGIPEGTVKSRLSYARGLLRKQLEEYMEER